MNRTLKLWLFSVLLFCLPVGMRAAGFSITTTSPLPAATYNQPYNVTMNVALGTAPITWSGSNLPPGLSISTGGVISGTPTAVGTYSTIVINAKDANNASAAGPPTFTMFVVPESTSISLGTTGNPSTFGAPVTFTATITSGVSGVISFYDGSTFLGTSTLSGNSASITAKLLPTGVNKIKAVYKGNANFLGSTGTLNQTVNSNPQAGLGTATLFAYGAAGTFQLVSGDFNGDGKIDVAVVNFVGHNVTILFGDGTGGLTAGNSYSFGSSAAPCAIGVGDFNNDGKQDLVVADCSAGQYIILIGDGAGNFAAHAPVSSGATGSPANIAVADFDGDGNADFAISSNTSGTVSVFLGSGSGTFGSANGLTAGTNPSSIVAGDFNGDGAPDLAVTNFGGTSVSVFLNLNDGTGGFNSATNYTTANANAAFGTNPFSIAIGDFNRDGILDLVTANAGSDAVAVLYGNGISGIGNGTFQTAVTYSVAAGSYPQYVAVGDFNGDGWADIITGDRQTNDVTVFLNGGSGNPGVFGAPATYSTSTTGNDNVNAIVVADMNGDGVSDIVETNYAASNLGVMLGLNPTTTTITSIPTTSIYGNSVSIVANVTPTTATGTGTFKDSGVAFATSPVQTLNPGAIAANYAFLGVGPHTITVTYNGDASDAPSTSTSASLTVSQVTTTTTLTSSANPAGAGQPITLTATALPTSGVSNPGGTVQFRNGSVVIATVSLSGGQATTTFNPGLGSYALTAVYSGDTNDVTSTSNTLLQAVYLATTTTLTSSANPSNAGQPVNLIATVTPSTATGRVTFFISGGNIGSSPLTNGTTTLTANSLPPGSYSITASYGGDANDGVSLSSTLTLIIKPATTTSLTVAPLTSTTLGTLVTLTATVSPASTGSVTFYNGAQILGTSTLSGSSATLATRLLPVGNNALSAYYIGNSSSSASSFAATSATTLLVASGAQNGFNAGAKYLTSSAGAWGTAVADFNGDGIADLVVANYNDSTPNVSVFIGNSNGTFNAATNYAVPNGPIAVAVGDFNGDGWPDIAVANYDSGSISILINNHSGGFNAAVNYTAGIGTEPEGIAIADYNGDGIADLAVVNNGSNSISILFGVGDGTFGAGTTYATGIRPGAIVAGDFNNDGQIDVATGNFGNTDIPGSISVFLNQGGGIFEPQVAYQTGGTGTYSLATADLNGDGILDLTTANSGSNNVSVLLGSSSPRGTFGAASLLTGGTFPASVAIGDFNGDGYLDIAAGNDTSNNVSIFLNQGGGAFGKATSYPLPAGASGARGLVVSDFNGDGISDIGVSNFASNSLSVMLGLVPTTTTLFSYENPSNYGDTVTLTATISPSNATGTVTFYDNGTSLGSFTVNSGAAALVTSSLVAGNHPITTVYSGDSTYAGSTGSGLTQTVNQVGTNISANPTLTGQNLSVAVTVTAASGNNIPTGTVGLYEGESQLQSGTLDVNGQATITTTLNPGNQTVVAIYSGDPNNAASASSFSENVLQPTSTYLTTSVNPGSSAKPVILTAYVNGEGATGTVTYYDGATSLGSGPVIGGIDPGLSVLLAAGTHSLTAVYSGDSNYAGSTSAPVSESILPGASVTLTSSTSFILFGAPVTLSGSVSPNTASGFMSFYDGVTFLGSGPITSGSASLKTTFINLGNRSITAYYSGDANNGANTSAGVSIAVASAPQNGFGTVVPYTVGANTYASAVGDFNGDGIEDFAVTSYSDGSSVAIFIGNGDGTFQTALNYDFPDQPAAIAVADLNHDGFQDLVVGAGSGVYTLLGKGDGTFQAASPAYGFGPIDSVAIADFDGDGLPDVIAGVTDGGLIPFLGNGDGSLAEQGIGGNLLQGTVVAVADFNQDGIADFVAADNYGNVDIYLGNGDGTFQTPVLYTSTGSPITVAAADLNNDGYPDVVVSSDGIGISVFLNNQNGTLGSPVVWNVGSVPGIVATGDFNGDGKIDIAVGDLESGAVNIMPGVGDGTFPTAVPYTVAGPVYSLAVGNFTGGSGRGDLAVTYGFNGDAGVLLSQQALTSTSVVLTSSVNPTTFGQNTTLTATVTPSTATGTVTFTDGGTSIGTGTITSGVATLTLNTLAAGAHTLAATYGGDANYAASNSNNVSQTVNVAAPAIVLTSTVNPSSVGTSVTFTATITPSLATGSVSFTDNGTAIGSGTLSGGVASFTTTTLAAGSHPIQATYGGDPNDTGANSNTITQVVNKIATTTTLTSSVNPTTFGQSTTLTANVSPAGVTGTVSFLDGATTLSTVTATSGVATLSISSLSATSHSLTAVYNGSTTYATSTSLAVTQVVNPLPIITSIVSGPNSSSPPLAPGSFATILGSTLAASIQSTSGAPWPTTLATTSVTVNGGAVPLSFVSPTQINFQVPYELAPGSYPVVVTNGGLQSNAFNLSIVPAAPALFSQIQNQGGGNNASGNGAIAGTTVLVHFTGLGVVSPAVADGAAAPASPLSTSTFTVTGTVNGTGATVSNVTLAPGFVAQAQANITLPANLTTGSYPLALTINGVTSQGATIYVTTPPALSITTSSPLPSGSVGSAYSTTLAATGGSGIAANYQWTSSSLPSGLSIGLTTGTISGTPLAAGNYSNVSITVTDTATGQSVSPTFTMTIGKSATSTALTSSLNPSTFGASVTLTATVTPSSATGTVTFLDGATSIGTGTLTGGVYALAINNLSVATHSITAVYNGDANDFTSTSSAVSQVVNQAATSTTLTSSLNPSISGQSVTFTAAVTPSAATGTITFNDGGTSLGTGTLSGGSATLTVSNLAIASHSITAVYGGDTNDVGSTSPTLTQVVNPIPNLVTNGDFETAIPGGSHPNIPGWSRADNANGSGESQFDNPKASCGIGGSQCAQLNAGGLGATISQTLSTTPGQIYQLIYFADNSTAGQPNGLSVIWDGSPVTGLTLANAPNQTYQQYTATVVASTASTVLAFSTSAAGNGWYLDNISVKAATGLPLITSISPAAGSASGGTAVTLTGQNFTGTTTVTFGGVAATGVAVINAGTGITATSPAAVAGLADVTVTTPAGNNGGSTGFTYQAVTTTTSLTNSPNPSQEGQSVTFTATVTTGATGTVSFYQNVSNLLGTATLVGGNPNVAIFSLNYLPAGTSSISATYGGDTTYGSSSSNTVSQTVNNTSATALTSSLNPSTFGASVTFTATVTPGTATGSVTFLDGTTTLGTGTLTSGVATFTTTSLTTTAHSITAVYGGDTNDLTSTSSVLTQTVSPASQTITFNSLPNKVFGTAPFTVAASTTSGLPVSFSTSSLIDVQFGCTAGSSCFTGASSLPQVGPAVVGNAGDTWNLISGLNGLGVTGTNVSLTDSHGNATAVTVSWNSDLLNEVCASCAGAFGGTPYANLFGGYLVNLTSTPEYITIHGLAPSTGYSLYVITQGDIDTAGRETQFVVNGGTPVITNAAANIGTFVNNQNYVLMNVASDSTGALSIAYSAASGEADVEGFQLFTGSTACSVSSATVTLLSAGTCTIQAAQPGSTNYLAATPVSQSFSITPTPSSTVLTSSLNPSAFGQSVTLTATITPSTATGTVSFSDSGTAIGSGTVSGGVATFTTTSLSVATHSITAAYSGDTSDLSSTSSALSQVVNKTTTTTSLTTSLTPSSYGASVTFTATLSPTTASGTVTFLDGSTSLGTGTLSGGVATLTTATLSVATHSITAVYSGDTNDLTSTSSALSQTVTQGSTTTTLTSSLNPSTYGASVTFTATLSPTTASGTVTFLDGSTTLGTGTLTSGVATFSTTALTAAASPHSITAVYGGDTDDLTSTSSALTQTVTPASQTITFNSLPNKVFGTAPFTIAASATSGLPVSFSANSLIDVQFGCTAGSSCNTGVSSQPQVGPAVAGNAGDTWNLVSGLNGRGVTGTNVSLTDTYGNATGVTVSWNADLLDEENAFSAGPFGGTPYANLFGDYLVNLSSTPEYITINGLAPSTAYSLYMFTQGDIATAGRETQFVVNGGTPVITSAAANIGTFVNNQNYVLINVTSDGTGALSIAYSAASGEADVEGFQLLGGSTACSVSVSTVTLLSAGSCTIQASQAGSTNYLAATPVSQSFSITPAPSSTVLTSSLNPSAFGQSVTLTATITPSTATGTVSFSDSGTAIGSGTVSGGVATFTTTSLSVATHSITAVYSGDTNDLTSTSSALSQVVNKTTTTTSLTSSLTPSTYGASVTFTATLSPTTASGTVSFIDGSTSLGTGTLSGGVTTFTTTSLSVATHSITAVYSGDTNDLTSTSSALSQVVNKTTTTTSLTSSLTPSTYGASVTFTATLSPTTASGTVSFIDGSTSLGTGTLSGGVVTFTTTSLSVATHSITAVYSGDTNDLTSTSSALSQVVNKTTTTTSLTSSLNASTYGASVTFTATLSPTTASGTVSFIDGSTSLGTGTLSGGVATFTTTSLSVATHSITAVYSGDTNDLTSTSSALSQVVNKATTTTSLTSSLTPSTYGASVTFTATLSPTTASGSVTFIDGSTSLGTATLSSGVATFTTTTLSVASHSITALYNGDSNDSISGSSTLTQVVNQASTTTTLISAPNPSTFGAGVTLTATVTPSGATGTVTFKDGATTLGSGAVSGGVATLGISSLAVGTHALTASYGGDTNDAPSVSVASTRYSYTSPTFTNFDGSANGLTTSNQITGYVSFTGALAPSTGFDARPDCTGDSNACATVTDFSFTDGINTLSKANGDQLWSNAGLSTAADGSINSWTLLFESAAAYAHSGGNQTGGWLTGDKVMGVWQSCNSYSDGIEVVPCPVISIAYGVGSAWVQPNGNLSNSGNWSGAVVAGAQTVTQAPTSTTLTSSLNPSTYGASVTFTATVSAALATGSVAFLDGSTTLGTGTVTSGVATFTTTALSVASHSITAVYSGDTNYLTSTSTAVSQVVNKAATTTSLTSSLNPSTFGASVTFTGTVSAVGATGTITFKDGAAPIGTGTVSSGVATFTTTALSVASHSITAVYSGDGSYLTSTSTAVSQGVNQAPTTITLSAAPSPSTFGQSVTLSASIAPATATGTITFLDGTTTLGTGTLSSGSTTFATTTLSVAQHSLTAVYSGDTNDAVSTSAVFSQLVNQAPTTTTLTSSQNPSGFSQPVTFTATISRSTATGTVTFLDGVATLGTGTVSSGVATFTTTSLAVAAHSITAVYGGDTNDAGSTSSALTQTVNQASTTTTLTSSLNPANFNQLITLSASVTPPSATGTVTFNDGGTAIGTGSVSGGVAVFQTSTLAVGTHSLTAIYGSDTNDAGSTSAALSQAVRSTTTTSLSVAPLNSSGFGASVILTATVAPVGATGKITFFDGVTPIGTSSIVSGQATLSTFLLQSGSNVLTARYLGDASNAPNASSPITQTVINATQAGFQTMQTYSTGPGTTGAIFPAVGDFNGDGNADLAIASFGSNTVSVLAGAGNGTFGAAATYNVDAGPYSIATGDFNGDGFTDLAVATSTGGTVDILLGKGNGTFQNSVSYNAGGDAVSIVVADFNGDGIADLATANYYAHSISLLLGTGTGTFGAAQTIATLPAGALPFWITAADFNGDGQADLAVADFGTADVNVLLANGVGTFAAPVSYSTGAGTSGARSIVTGDFNGDGVPDLAVANNGSSNVSIFIGSTSGVFGTPTLIPTDANPYTLAVADLNGDGISDLAVGYSVSDNITQLIGNNLGGFTATFSPGTTVAKAYAIAVGDFNKDGRTDLAVTDFTNSNVDVLLGRAQSATLLTSSVNPSIFGQSTTLTASVAPSSATGTVTFIDGSNALGTVTMSGGAASLVISSLVTGTHSITALYNGDAADAASSSAALSQVVNQTSTSTTLLSSLNPSAFNQQVSYTASVSPATATGTITFKDGAATLGTVTVVSGSAVYAAAAPAVGSHSITAIYNGDANDVASTSSALTQVVNQSSSTTTLISSINPSALNQSVGFTATVSPSTATGAVTFKDGAVTIGTGTIASGVATFSTAALGAGPHSITAVYGGDTNYTGSTSSAFTQTVNQNSTTTTLTSSLNPAAFGQSVTITANVLPASATGTITFRDGSTSLGTVTMASGSASLTTSTLSVGAHSITAVYSGDTNDLTSTASALTETINQASSTTTVTSQNNPAILGQTVTLTVAVSPSTATGTVTLNDGGSPIGGPVTLTSGAAAFTTTTLALGSHSLTVSYSGDVNYLASTSSALTQTVSPASQTITFNSLPNKVFGNAPFTVAASATSGLPVSFSASSLIDVQFGCTAGTSCNTGVSSQPQVGPAVVGNAGDTWNLVSGLSGLGATGTNVALTDTYGNATGVTVSWNSDVFFDLGTASAFVGTPYANLFSGYLVNHTSAPEYITINGLAPSTAYSLYMFTQGDIRAGGRETQFVVNGGTPVISNAGANIGTLVNNQNYVLMNVASDSTGALSIVYSTAAGEADIEGFQLFGGSTACSVSSATVTLLSAGTCTIQAAQTGNANYLAATPVSRSFLITPGASSTSLSSSSNPAVIGLALTFTATVTPSTATGTVTFFDGTTSLGSPNVTAGVAQLGVSLTPGLHTITATYNGDTNDLGSSSPTLTQSMTYPALTINTSSVPAGQSGVAYGPVSFSASGGSGNFNWTASGLPNGLSLGSGGTLSGTPAGGFNGTFSVTVSDVVSGGSATQSYSLLITSLLSITGPSSLGSVLAGKPVAGSFTASGGTPPYTWTLSGGGGFSVDGNGNVTGVTGGPGNYSLILTVTDAAKGTASLGLTYSSFGITTTSLPNANITSNYSAAITAAGGTPPYTVTASGLPPGLAVSSGSIGGRATTAGTYPVSVQVSDSQGLSASASFTITVTGSTALTITSSSLANGTVGQPYSQALSASGGSPAYTWTQSGGVLPPGLSLGGSGTISGMPTTPGTYSVGVQATDTVGGQAVASVSIVIQPAPLTITSGNSLPSGIINSPYPSQILTASGGVAPYTFSITGSLPDGLTLANGQIGGTPTAAGSFSFTVVAKDSAIPPVTGTLGVSAVIRGPAPDLVLSAGTASFSLTAGTSAAPSGSSVTVSSSDSSQTLNFSIGGSSAPWLSATGGTSTPASLSIGLTSAALALTSAGSPYSGSVTLTCSSSVCAGKSQTVNVTLSVTDGPPQLTVGSQLLSFVGQAPNPQPSSTTLAIQNTGGGNLTVSSVTAADSWISVGAFPATIPPGPGASVSITVNPAALPAGFYTSSIAISTSAGSAVVPVSLLISANSTMSLGPAGAQFSMPQGGALGNASGSFLVSISNATPVNYTATVLAGASWLLGGGAGSASGTGPGTVTYSLDQTQLATFAPGAYYGTIEVAASGAVNTPQDYQVVLNISPASTPVVPDPEPAGLVFLSSTAGPLPPQNIQVFASSKTPLSFQASAATSSGGNWLSISGGTGSAVAGAPGTVLASVDSTGLKPGLYRGTVSFASGPSVRTVNVTLVAETPATATPSAISSLHPNAAGPICAGGQLAPTQTGLVSNFSAPASWPTPMAITLVDTCGSLIGSGQIIATFSNGDPPLELALVNAAQGLYSGTWTPRKTSSQTTITAHVSASGYSATTVQIAGQVTPNAAPSLAPNGTLDVFHPLVGAGLGPGNIVQIYGSALATQAVSATTLPLPTNVNGTQVLIGGIQSPLFYVSPGQVNAQIPFELQAGQQYQVIVSANGALTTPQPIQLNAGTPAVLQFTSGLLVAQHQDASLVSTDSPAVPGEYLTLYMTGLGATDIPVPSGQASPTSPLANVLDVPTLTINGTQVPLLFAGLTPGLVGLYQINIQVPAGLPSDTYNVVVTQDGVASNSTLLPVVAPGN